MANNTKNILFKIKEKELYIDDIYIIYDYPQLFSCRDLKTDDPYMCLLVDYGDLYTKWLLTPISEKDIQNINDTKELNEYNIFTKYREKLVIITSYKLSDNDKDYKMHIKYLKKSSNEVFTYIPTKHDIYYISAATKYYYYYL